MSEHKTGLWAGSVEFSGFGGFPERMTDALLKKGIKLRRIRFGDGTISGVVSPLDYWETAAAARKYGVRIRAGKRKGLYFTLLHYSRRAGLYLGLLAFILLTSLNESAIQDIEINSGSAVTASQRAQIMTILDECGIVKGASSRRLDTTEAERRVMLEIPEAAWVDISVVGFRAIATVEMVTPQPEMLNSDTPCNIIASRAATIIDHTVRAGAITAETGSGVQQGGLLVSGIVADSAGNISYKHASAEIIGEFTETEEFFVPYRETVRTPDGEQTEYSWLVFQDDVYPLFLGKAEVPDAVYSEQTEPVYLFGQKMPLTLRRGTFTRLRETELVRSADDCIAEIARRQAAFEENFFGEYEIVSCEKTAVPEQDGIRLTAVYTLRGNIAQEQELFVEQRGAASGEDLSGERDIASAE